MIRCVLCNAPTAKPNDWVRLQKDETYFSIGDNTPFTGDVAMAFECKTCKCRFARRRVKKDEKGFNPNETYLHQPFVYFKLK